MKQRLILGALTVLFLLTGCDLPKNSELKKSNQKLDTTLEYMLNLYLETKKLGTDQRLVTAAEMFREKGHDFMRVRSILIFLETGNLTEVLWQYMGAPRPIYGEKAGIIGNYDSPAELKDTPLAFDFLNVSYVYPTVVRHRITLPSGEIAWNKMLKAVDKDFHDFLSAALDDAIEQIMIFHKSGYEDEEARQKNLDRARRVYHVGTTVYGGRELLEGFDRNGDGDIKDFDRDIDGRTVRVVEQFAKVPEGKSIPLYDSAGLAHAQSNDQMIMEKNERVWFARALAKLLNTVGLVREIPKLESIVQTRMGLRPEEWVKRD